MAILLLRSIADRLVVAHANGEETILHEGGVPVAPLLAGWQCDGVIDSFAPLYLVALRHAGGMRAVWVLDATMQRVALSLATLHEPHRAQLQQSAVGAFMLLHDTVLAPAVPRPAGAVVGLELLDDAVLAELAGMAVGDILAQTTVAMLPDAPPQIAGFATEALRATLAGDLRQDYLDLMSGRGMRCPSPDGNGLATAQFGMIMRDRTTVYRFAGAFGRVFYVTTKDYYDRKFSIYIPNARLYGANHYAPDARAFLIVLLGHAAAHQNRMCKALTAPRTAMQPANFLSDYPTLHIGHVIWNDLTGLEELASTLPPSSLPEVVVINAPEGSEPFGPVESLFPQFAGKVRRPTIRWEDAAAYVYDNNLFYMRFLSRYVTTGVGRRVMALVAEDPRLVGDRALADRIVTPSKPCILLGLRVGNRSLQDQVDSLARMIDHLLARLGQVTIVLDGANARLALDPSTTYASFGPPGGEEPLIEELRIVFALRRRFHVSNASIVSTVGCPLASSLFWAERSSFFVAPWGAALAKYRWLCNLPGFVVTNRHNIGAPTGDLPIYHAPDFMQDPSVMRFVGLEHIADAPGQGGFYASFTIDPKAIADGIDEMISLTGLGRPTD